MKIILDNLDNEELIRSIFYEIVIHKGKLIASDVNDKELTEWLKEKEHLESNNEAKEKNIGRYQQLVNNINDRIKEIIHYYDDEKFALSLRKYMPGIPLTDKVASELHTVMNRQKGRKTKNLKVLSRLEENRRELKVSLFSGELYRLFAGVPDGEESENNEETSFQELIRSNEFYLMKNGDEFNYVFMGVEGRVEGVIKQAWLEKNLPAVNKANKVNYTINDIVEIFGNPTNPPSRVLFPLNHIVCSLILIHSGKENQQPSDYYLSTGFARESFRTH